MLQRIIALAAPVLVFFGLLALLIIAWYVALPLLAVFLVVSWLRAREIRKSWEALFNAPHPAGSTGHRKKIADENIIDADYEELDS